MHRGSLPGLVAFVALVLSSGLSPLSAQAGGECLDCWWSTASDTHITCKSWTVVDGWFGIEHCDFAVVGDCNMHPSGCQQWSFKPADTILLAGSEWIDAGRARRLLADYPERLRMRSGDQVLEVLDCADGRVLTRLRLVYSTIPTNLGVEVSAL